MGNSSKNIQCSVIGFLTLHYVLLRYCKKQVKPLAINALAAAAAAAATTSTTTTIFLLLYK